MNMELQKAQEILSQSTVSQEVFDLRPDYRAGLLVVLGITPHESSDVSEQLLQQAEEVASELLAQNSVEELAHIAMWRDTYQAFGAKPQRTRNSLEALTRRAAQGLPRVNRLTDIYNALSVIHQIPLGGENLDAYVGAPKLIRAQGTETFDTTVDGQTTFEKAELGEVVWTDSIGVTCRRWNWRQCNRTRLTNETTNAIFIIDALAAVNNEQLHSMIDELKSQFKELGNLVEFESRIISAN